MKRGRPLDPRVTEGARLVLEDGLTHEEAARRSGARPNAITKRLRHTNGYQPAVRRPRSEALEEALRLYRDGELVVAIVARTGVAQNMIYRHARDAGVARRRGRPADPRVDDAIALVQQEGISVREAARRTGASVNTLRNRLRGDPDRPPPERSGARVREATAVVRAEVVRLRDEEGLMFKDIAARVGLSVSRTQALYDDPDGAKDRERKRRRSRPCAGCGKPVHNSGSEPPERCAECAQEHSRTMDQRRKHSTQDRRVWTDDGIGARLRHLARDGAPTKRRYDTWYAGMPEGTMPSSPTIITRYGSWNEALAAAGVNATPTRGVRIDARSYERALMDVVRCARDLGEVPSAAQYRRWRHGVDGAYSDSRIRQVAGSWIRAVEDAGRVLSGELPEPDADARPARDPDALLGMVRACAADLGHVPMSSEYAEWSRDRSDVYNGLLIGRELGGWRAIRATLEQEQR
jgi:predicted DNA-binding protein (UPF0251 family)